MGFMPSVLKSIVYPKAKKVVVAVKRVCFPVIVFVILIVSVDGHVAVDKVGKTGR